MRGILIAAAIFWVAGPAQAAQFAQGRVFHDLDGNGVLDVGERGIQGIPVSNGVDIVLSDAKGRWRLAAGERTTLFVMPGQGWAAPLDRAHRPQFHYVHNVRESAPTQYPGPVRTDALPPQVDFALVPSTVGDNFSIFVFGDPQPRNIQQLDALARDVIAEASAVQGPVLGVSLGDIVNDELSLYGDLNSAFSMMGLPWFNVPGNHDLNFDADTDEASDETFESVYGPPTYAFQVGRVHFLILDDVIYLGREVMERNARGQDGQRPYVGGLREDQFRFIENWLARVPREDLVVMSMHIPLFQRRTSNYEGIESFRSADRERLFALLKDHPHTLSLSAHTHFQAQHFFDADQGWPQERPHHHINLGTSCGDWFSGLPTFDGYPDTTMRDGTPNGYAVLHFEGNRYRWRYRVAGAPADRQMSLYVPFEVASEALATTPLHANFYVGNVHSRLQFRLQRDGQWQDMQAVYEPDPRNLAMHAWQQRLGAQLREGAELPFKTISAPQPTDHLWKAMLPAELTPGYHLAEVRATTGAGETFVERISFRVR